MTMKGLRGLRSKSFAPALAFLAGRALAHDTWIVPDKPQVTPGETISLNVTSGMAFPVLESGPSPAWMGRVVVRLAGRVSDIAERSPQKTALRLSVTLKETGVATLWVETKPRPIELTPAEVEEYLGEIGALETAGREWKAAGFPKWREVYAKQAKTFVRVGEPTDDRSWAESVGVGLEIVPEQDPTAVRKGEDLRLRVLLAGVPLSGLSVAFVQAGQRKAVMRKTDAEGRARFPLERRGWALVRATHLVRVARPDADWESHFATVTVNIR